MKAFVITILGLSYSESDATRCIQSGAEFGLTIQRFPAITRYQAETVMKQSRLKLNRRIYKAISDQPIGDRGKVPRGKWWLTTPELGCFMSHYTLWQKCINLDESIIILEHDAVFVAPVPELPPDVLALNLFQTEHPISVGYVLTPKAARLAVRESKRKGIQPSDDVLWRAALRSKKTAVCEQPVVLHENGGISTIQYTREDETHKNIKNKNPWLEYSQQ